MISPQRTGIDLGAPAQHQFSYGPAVRGVDQNPASRGAHRTHEPIGGAPSRGFVGRSVGTVEADYGVHMDGRPLLVLSDTSKGQPSVVGEP
ncbi:hypothetical protein RKD26_003881 [Streptomyces calvus]